MFLHPQEKPILKQQIKWRMQRMNSKCEGRRKNKNKIMQERVTEKYIVQRRSKEKSVLQSKLHCRAYKL